MHTHFNPIFTIITVTFNAESVLEDTILSIISQTYHHIQYIIVDGKSTDNTLAIAEKYKDRIDTVISEKDNGLYDAMNKGLKLAKGDYICFLNAGDSFHEDSTLHQMVQSVQNNFWPDILYGETAIVDKDRHFIKMRKLSAPSTLNWKSFSKGMLVCHQAFFVKHTIVESYNEKYKFSSDFDWCIRAMKKAKRIHNTNVVLIDYLNEGLTTANHKKSLLERFHIMTKYYGLLPTLWNHFLFCFR